MSDPTPEEIQQLQSEWEQMRLAVSDVTIAWSSLENGLAMLLSKLIKGHGDFDHDIAFGIYFAPRSADGRIGILEAAYEYSVLQTSLDDDRLKACFAKAIEKLHKLKKKRNEIIHGNIVSEETPIKGGVKRGIRLTGPLFDPKYLHARRVRGCLPGITGSEVKKAAEAMSMLATIFSEITNLIADGRTLRGERLTAKTFEALQEWTRKHASLTERLLQLGVRLNMKDQDD